jgi:hypothetical protein
MGKTKNPKLFTCEVMPMIQQNLFSFKVKSTDTPVISFSGLPLLATLAHSLGLFQRLASDLHLRRRNRGYNDAEKTLSLALLLAAGGQCLEDIRVLQRDRGLVRVFGRPLPSDITLGNFLRAFNLRALRALTRIDHWFIRQVIERLRLTRITIDIDATLIKCYKRLARITYKGFRGYDPVIASIAGLGLILSGLFRPGNASPGANALSFLKRIIRILPTGITIRLRSDSAWYIASVMDYADEQGIEFAITADMDPGVRATIEAIPEEDWHPLAPHQPDGCQVAETVHTLNHSRGAYRLLVIRDVRRQVHLFEGPYVHHAVITNIPTHSPRAIIRWHRKRADLENLIKEAKYGFALAHLPCGTLTANAAYFQIALLAHNLVQAWKLLTLPSGWHRYTVKTLRFRLLCVAGTVTRHARQLTLNLPRDHPFLDLYRQSRFRTIGLAAE